MRRKPGAPSRPEPFAPRIDGAVGDLPRRDATELNSDVKSVKASACLSTSSKSSVPHRRSTSCLSAASVCGSGSASSVGTTIHGSPRRAVIRTPPAESVTIARSSDVRAVVRRC
jgi:hypothetical protein